MLDYQAGKDAEITHEIMQGWEREWAREAALVSSQACRICNSAIEDYVARGDLICWGCYRVLYDP